MYAASAEASARRRSSPYGRGAALPLARSTRQVLRRLGVDLIERITNNEFAWQHYTNKILALLAAEDAVAAQQYIWLDSDVLSAGGA